MTHLQPLYEEGSRATHPDFVGSGTGPPNARGGANRRQVMQRQLSAITVRTGLNQDARQRDIDANVVDVLDVIG
jgi:hypothetical protein